MSRIVLLVEDSRDDEELALLALEAAGIESVRVARSGVEALEHFFGADGAPGERLPDLVLLDLKLPKLDGFDVLGRLRSEASLRRVPIVVLSTSDTRADIERCYALGASSYVRKPVEYARFADVVRQIVTYWLDVNQP